MLSGQLNNRCQSFPDTAPRTPYSIEVMPC